MVAQTPTIEQHRLEIVDRINARETSALFHSLLPPDVYTALTALKEKNAHKTKEVLEKEYIIEFLKQMRKADPNYIAERDDEWHEYYLLAMLYSDTEKAAGMIKKDPASGFRLIFSGLNRLCFKHQQKQEETFLKKLRETASSIIDQIYSHMQAVQRNIELRNMWTQMRRTFISGAAQLAVLTTQTAVTVINSKFASYLRNNIGPQEGGDQTEAALQPTTVLDPTSPTAMPPPTASSMDTTVTRGVTPGAANGNNENASASSSQQVVEYSDNQTIISTEILRFIPKILLTEMLAGAVRVHEKNDLTDSSGVKTASRNSDSDSKNSTPGFKVVWTVSKDVLDKNPKLINIIDVKGSDFPSSEAKLQEKITESKKIEPANASGGGNSVANDKAIKGADNVTNIKETPPDVKSPLSDERIQDTLGIGNGTNFVPTSASVSNPGASTNIEINATSREKWKSFFYEAFYRTKAVPTKLVILELYFNLDNFLKKLTTTEKIIRVLRDLFTELVMLRQCALLHYKTEIENTINLIKTSFYNCSLESAVENSILLATNIRIANMQSKDSLKLD